MMRLLAIILLFCAMFYDTPVLHAEESCDGVCIDTDNLDVRIITISKGTHDYTIPAAKNEQEKNACDEKYESPLCDTGGVVIHCEDDIDYVQFSYLIHQNGKVPDNNVSSINEMLKNIASKLSCNPKWQVLTFHPKQIWARNNLLSIVFMIWDEGQGAASSCQGHFDTYTFDTLSSDKPLTLHDIIAEKDFPALKVALQKNFKAEYEETPYQGTLDEQTISQNLENGFFIEKGKVKINISGFIFSCADGPFHPVEVPDALLKPEFLSQLRNARK